MIRPLRNQILIRPILENKYAPDSAVIMPDSAVKSTVQGSDGSMINFVTAEVVSVGPGRPRVDADLIPDVVALLDSIMSTKALTPVGPGPSLTGYRLLPSDLYEQIVNLRARCESDETIPIELQPGDTILYHPSVRNFDKNRSLEIDGVEHFIIGEHSLLAKVEP